MQHERLNMRGCEQQTRGALVGLEPDGDDAAAWAGARATGCPGLGRAREHDS
jgi:hypothetical protein